MKRLIVFILLCVFVAGCSHATSSNTFERTPPYEKSVGPSESSKRIIEIRKYHPDQNIEIDVKEEGKKKYKITKKNGKIIVEVI